MSSFIVRLSGQPGAVIVEAESFKSAAVVAYRQLVESTNNRAPTRATVELVSGGLPAVSFNMSIPSATVIAEKA